MREELEKEFRKVWGENIGDVDIEIGDSGHIYNMPYDIKERLLPVIKKYNQWVKKEPLFECTVLSISSKNLKDKVVTTLQEIKTDVLYEKRCRENTKSKTIEEMLDLEYKYFGIIIVSKDSDVVEVTVYEEEALELDKYCPRCGYYIANRDETIEIVREIVKNSKTRKDGKDRLLGIEEEIETYLLQEKALRCDTE